MKDACFFASSFFFSIPSTCGFGHAPGHPVWRQTGLQYNPSSPSGLEGVKEKGFPPLFYTTLLSLQLASYHVCFDHMMIAQIFFFFLV